MPSNIEIKARVADRDALIDGAARLATSPRIDIEQDDTFFRCGDGRLKLRTLHDDHGELIFYQRADEAGPRASFYTATATSDPDGLRETLTLAYGSAGRVRKHRVAFIAGRTRIHLDRVEDLGDFIELEVAIDDPAETDGATTEAQAIMATLGIDSSQLVSTAYIDLAKDPR
ncbi:class IV adenylate cyclase (plasmid) [Coraliomargarita sp. W4R53]